MIRFTAKIGREQLGPDKVGWSYIILSAALCARLNPGVRRAFRVKGKLDNFPIERASLLPIRGGRFMLPINAAMRKGTSKAAGDKLVVELELDKRMKPRPADFISCLKDDPEANGFFRTLSTSQKNFFYSWVGSAKTIETRTKRITMSLNALQRRMNYVEMIREHHRKRKSEMI